MEQAIVWYQLNSPWYIALPRNVNMFKEHIDMWAAAALTPLLKSEVNSTSARIVHKGRSNHAPRKYLSILYSN